MTLLETRPVEVVVDEAPVIDEDERGRVARPSRVMLAALLASAAAAWVAGGVFQGWFARPVALAGAAAGVGGVWLAVRRGRPVLQYAVVPGAFVLGYLAALILPNDTGVTGTVPDLVRHAIQNGGLADPPVPFDPGWRFVIVALMALIGAAGASLGVGLQRPKLALLVPLPMVVAGALSQPSGSEVLSGVVALVLLVAALMMSFSAELGAQADTGPRFEARQLLRGSAGVGASLLVLALLSQASLLFPEPDTERAARPQKPQILPISKVKDRPLFEAQSESTGPWRLGVLDEYDKGAWLLPPFDLKRYVDPGDDGALARASLGRPTVKATITVRDIGGFTIPTLANPVRIGRSSGDVGYDPRAQILRVRRGSPGDGYRYTFEAARPPTGKELAAAVGPVADEVARFVKAPPPPLVVSDLLASAPNNPWERLEFLRSKLYENVVAAGSGVPVDINSARVAELLRGGTGTPYEIVASEALLARWAGLPARIGYGFKGGTPLPGRGDGAVEFRPKDGANWLEAWFPGFGWVPIVGVPPKAQASLNNLAKNQEDQVRPTEDLSLQIYLPVQNPNPLLFFQVARYWLFAALPFVLLFALLVAALPWLLKVGRRRRRLRWAVGRGPGARVAVAYAEFRDCALDLNVGDRGATPLEFLACTVDDDEHAELAWLVTRGLYGDLARDLLPSDADAAEVMSASLRRRLLRAQTGVTQVGALISKASLRAPYDEGVPNLWFSLRRPRRPRLRWAAAVLLLFGVSCGGSARAEPAAPLPARILPERMGDLVAAPEPSSAPAFKKAGSSSMVARGVFWTIRRPEDRLVQAALQVSVLKPRFDTDDLVVQRGVRSFIETGHYRWFKVEGQWVGVQELSELRLYLWFPPSGNSFEILQVRPEYPDAKGLLTSVLRYQRGAS